MKIYIVFIFLVVGQLFAQTYSLDNKFSISVPKRTDWSISTHYFDTVNNVYKSLTLNRDLKSRERKFSEITIQYETLNESTLTELKKDNCDLGTITKIDTVNVSGYKVRRQFGINCDWLIEDRAEEPIAGYSVRLLVNINESTFLRIMGDYFSENEIELKSIESELLTVIEELKITKL